jgi:aerotaxis receptor
MRSNLPVTHAEYILQEGEAPTSRTDVHGNITYVNQDFLAISGFTEEELIGAPQNIVRHPDMPAEAFADLWRTIQSGKAWTGLVKNRCKNGDHYWVEANVAPLMQEGVLVGYTSVRSKPTRDQVAAAEQAYAALRAGSKTLAVCEGQALTRSCLNKRDFSLKAMLVVAAGSVGTLFAGIGLLAWLGLSGDSTFYLKVLLGIAAVGIPMAAVFGWLSYRSVVVPLETARHEIDRLSSGDLTGRIPSQGLTEFARVLNSMRVLQTNLKWLTGQIKETTACVATGSHEIAAGAADLSGRTESQAASLEETASSMEELTSTVKQNAEHAAQANQLSVSATHLAGEGGQLVGRVVTNMADIKESSRKIADILSVIDGLAFQTNILSLNAAVEAARAGEHGRGFAVVATEVRHLANRSAAAAKEIKTLIEDSVEKVEAGSRMADEAGAAMQKIVSSVQQVTEFVGGIAVASQEQSAGIEQVNQAVGHMDEMTQQNAALVEQAATSSASLQSQADVLAQLVDSFKLSQSVRSRHESGPRQAPRQLALVRATQERASSKPAAGKNLQVARRRA